MTAPDPVIALLAVLVIGVQELDLLTGVRMITIGGLGLEQNPVARTLYALGGAELLGGLKVVVVLMAALLLVRLARFGRPRVARNALVACTVLGLLGVTSNLVYL